jgi:hypothetical protein
MVLFKYLGLQPQLGMNTTVPLALPAPPTLGIDHAAHKPDMVPPGVELLQDGPLAHVHHGGRDLEPGLVRLQDALDGLDVAGEVVPVETGHDATEAVTDGVRARVQQHAGVVEPVGWGELPAVGRFAEAGGHVQVLVEEHCVVGCHFGRRGVEPRVVEEVLGLFVEGDEQRRVGAS